jgi:hypothetical protein
MVGVRLGCLTRVARRPPQRLARGQARSRNRWQLGRSVDALQLLAGSEGPEPLGIRPTFLQHARKQLLHYHCAHNVLKDLAQLEPSLQEPNVPLLVEVEKGRRHSSTSARCGHGVQFLRFEHWNQYGQHVMLVYHGLRRQTTLRSQFLAKAGTDPSALQCRLHPAVGA